MFQYLSYDYILKCFRYIVLKYIVKINFTNLFFAFLKYGYKKLQNHISDFHLFLLDSADLDNFSNGQKAIFQNEFIKKTPKALISSASPLSTKNLLSKVFPSLGSQSNLHFSLLLSYCHAMLP